MPTVTTARRRRPQALALLAGAMIASGCAEDGWAGRRFRPGTNSSTVAPDRAQFPRGEVIPPAGFGVDLVDASSPSAAGREPDAVTRTSFTGTSGSLP